MLELLRTAFIFLVIVPILWGLILKLFRKIFNIKAPEPDSFESWTDILSHLLVVMVVFIFFAYGSMGWSETIYEGERKLVAVQDNTSFVISRYNADSKNYYYYFVKYGDGYKQYRAPASRSTIYYVDDPKEAHIKYYDQQAKWAFFRFMIPWDTTGDSTYKLYVPKGTIQEDFTIDLE